MRGPSKLKRPEPARARVAAEPEADPQASMADLLSAQAFEEALERGAWWGAPLGDRGQEEIEATMREIARDGSRCAWVAARSGPVGYWALLAHPADAAKWPSRWMSRSGSQGRSSPHAQHLVFAPMARADFPRGAPTVFSTNEAAALAWRERRELGACAGEAVSPRAKRI